MARRGGPSQAVHFACATHSRGLPIRLRRQSAAKTEEVSDAAFHGADEIFGRGGEGDGGQSAGSEEGRRRGGGGGGRKAGVRLFHLRRQGHNGDLRSAGCRIGGRAQ